MNLRFVKPFYEIPLHVFILIHRLVVISSALLLINSIQFIDCRRHSQYPPTNTGKIGH